MLRSMSSLRLQAGPVKKEQNVRNNTQIPLSSTGPRLWVDAQQAINADDAVARHAERGRRRCQGRGEPICVRTAQAFVDQGAGGELVLAAALHLGGVGG